MTAVTLKLDMPIRSVNLLNEKEGQEGFSDQHSKADEQQKQQIHSLCTVLEQVINGIEQSYQNLFASQKDKVVQLSINIARKILAYEIDKGNYDIKNIILEAIQTIPVSGQTIVRLNPADLETLRMAMKTDNFEIPEKIQFIDDQNVRPAECIVESDQGVVEYLIEEHLKQIESALMETLNPAQETQT
jgi:flagellar biosynthesis/type III secretory pathway protein FliH